MGIVLRNVVALVDGKANETVDIRIRGKKLDTIGESVLPVSETDTIIDGEGKLAVPGFVNAHTHLPMVLFRGLAEDISLSTWLEDYIWPAERELTSEDVYWGSLLGIAEMLKGGTTQFADMYFHTGAIGRAVTDSGIRALLSYGIVAQTLDKHGKQEMERASGIIDRWQGAADGRIRTAVSPHAVYTCGKETWRAVINLAQERDVPLHIHLSETREEVDRCREEWNETPVRALDRLGVFAVPTLAAHCVHVDQEEIERLAERNVTVVHCPKSNAKLGNGNAPIVALRSAGARVALGTDGAASNNSLDMMEEMRFASLFQKGSLKDPTAIPAREAVRMATECGAAALGSGAREIAVGEDADLILIDLDRVDTVPAYEPVTTLVYAAHADSVTDVIVAGEFLLRDRELLTIDEERVKYEVKRRSRHCIN